MPDTPQHPENVEMLRAYSFRDWNELSTSGQLRRIANLLIRQGAFAMTAFDDLRAMIAGVRADANEVVRVVEALVAAKDDPEVSDAEVLAMVDDLRGVRQMLGPVLEMDDDVAGAPTGITGTTDSTTPATESVSVPTDTTGTVPDPNTDDTVATNPSGPELTPEGTVNVTPTNGNPNVTGPVTPPPPVDAEPVDDQGNPVVTQPTDMTNDSVPGAGPITVNPQDGGATETPPPVNG